MAVSRGLVQAVIAGSAFRVVIRELQAGRVEPVKAADAASVEEEEEEA